MSRSLGLSCGKGGGGFSGVVALCVEESGSGSGKMGIAQDVGLKKEWK